MELLRLVRFVRRFLHHRRTCARLKSVGTGVEFDGRVQLVFPERIDVGDHVYFGPGTYLNGRGGLTIADHVIFAPEVAVMTSMHRYRGAEMVPYDQVETLKPVIVERCVWIGMRAMLMPGVRIGEGSIVGAGAIVTKSCPPGSVLAGNPARVVGSRDMAAYGRCVEEGQFYLKLKQERRLSKVERTHTGGGTSA